MTLFPIITALVDIPISRTQVSPYIFPNTCHSFWSFSPSIHRRGYKAMYYFSFNVPRPSDCDVQYLFFLYWALGCLLWQNVFPSSLCPFLSESWVLGGACVFWISNLCHICHLQVFLSFTLLNEFWGTLKFLVWIVTRSFSPTHKFPKKPEA